MEDGCHLGGRNITRQGDGAEKRRGKEGVATVPPLQGGTGVHQIRSGLGEGVGLGKYNNEI